MAVVLYSVVLHLLAIIRITMSLSYADIIVAICEFLETAFHTILCLRQVYPAQVFVKRKRYDASVFQSRSPSLNEYISASVKSIGQELLVGQVRSVVLVIKDKGDVALERFVFSINNVVGIEQEHLDTPIPEAITHEELEQYFRSFLVKLGSAEAQLLSNQYDQDELSFCIILEMKDNSVPSAAPNEPDPVPWVPAVAQHTAEGASDEDEAYMVRAVETGIVNFSLAIQESKEKVERKKSRAGKGKEVV